MLGTTDLESTAVVSATDLVTDSILVATDGSHDSDGAVRVGIALARRDGARADLFSVVEPLPPQDAIGIQASDIDSLTLVARESRDEALLAQRDRTHPGIRHWPFTVHIGDRVERIVGAADANGAWITILGLGAHGLNARLLQRETAIRVMRAARTPVLAVPNDVWGVPHRALAAIDFTASSEHAARAALRLLGNEGTLYLAHVTPRIPIPRADSRGWDETATPGVLARLEILAKRLDRPRGVEIEYVSLHGEPAHELLAFGEQYHIDLVAAGAHGRSALGRLLMGSVSTKLVRTAHCWVLVAPPEPKSA
jgi:nucleotide-binding universal stress UspA family protein